MRNSIARLIVATPVVGHQVRQHRGYDKASTLLKFIAAALLVGVGLVGGSALAGLDAPTDVAHVEYLTGRVVAFSQGRPTLLDVLDTINDRTQLDLLANSELRICHYQTRQLLTLKGPLRASVSRDGVTVENGKAVITAAGSCATPTVSTFHGGLVARGAKTTAVPSATATTDSR
jgi:hypothetical protein